MITYLVLAIFTASTFPSYKLTYLRPVSIVEQSEASTVYDSLNIEIAGLNPGRGMNVCLHVSVVCCPVFW
jgi:hypothetical protein